RPRHPDADAEERGLRPRPPEERAGPAPERIEEADGVAGPARPVWRLLPAVLLGRARHQGAPDGLGLPRVQMLERRDVRRPRRGPPADRGDPDGDRAAAGL